MAYTSDCISAVAAYNAAMAEHDSKVSQIEQDYRNENITAKAYEEKKREIAGVPAVLRDQLTRAIFAARDSYIAALPDRYRKDAETINSDDLALLKNDDAGLTAADVERMFNSYDGNLGMQASIAAINSRREDPASLVFFDQQTRENDARTFAEKMIYGATSGGMGAALAETGRYVVPSLNGE